MHRAARLLPLIALSLPLAEATAQSAAGTPAVYDATQVAYGHYTVVKRLGIGDWRSAIGIGGQPDLASAQRVLLAEAARVGAEGVVNLTCFDQTDRIFNPAGYFCYGNAIKLKK